MTERYRTDGSSGSAVRIVRVISELQRRLASHGAQPFLTYYDAADGSRIELSAVTFANWVDKTANLIADLGHEDGDPIDVALAESNPGHWVTLVWIAAAWQRGCPVHPGVSGADLLVVGPGDARRAPDTVACSLHPLGIGFPTPPAGALDYREVFAQPDVHDVSPLGTATGWAGQLAPRVEPRDDRLLLADPLAAWSTVADALVAPAMGTGSTVIAVGYDDEGLARLAEAEKARL